MLTSGPLKITPKQVLIIIKFNIDFYFNERIDLTDPISSSSNSRDNAVKQVHQIGQL